MTDEDFPRKLREAFSVGTDIRAGDLRGITSERPVVLDGAKILSDPRIPPR